MVVKENDETIYKNVKTHNVYHSCFRFIFYQTEIDLIFSLKSINVF